MKRDMDLCRRILLAAESIGGDSTSILRELREQDDNKVVEHVILLREAGLIDVTVRRGQHEVVWNINRLTWAGHDFLDAARAEGRWVKVKDRLGDAWSTVSFTLLKELLDDLARKALGLRG